jgi:hypothetical protein
LDLKLIVATRIPFQVESLGGESRPKFIAKEKHHDGKEPQQSLSPLKLGQRNKPEPKFIEHGRVGDERAISDDFRLDDISVVALRIMTLVLECL